MDVKDLSFDVINEDGVELTCDVLSVVPNEDNADEPYVVFTDYLLDDNDEFSLQFGKLIKNNEEYQLQRVEDSNVISKIRDQLTDDIVKYVNNGVLDNLYE